MSIWRAMWYHRRKKTGTDAVAPTIGGQTPAPDATGVASTSNIAFTLFDTGGAGINQAATDVQVEGVDAVINGVIQAAFAGGAHSISIVGTDLVVVLDPVTPFVPQTTINVEAQTADVAGNPATFSYSFTIRYESTRAISFDGTTEHMHAGITTALNNATSATFSFWAKADADIGMIMSRYEPSGTRRQFTIAQTATDGDLTFVSYADGATPSVTAWNDALIPNQWHHYMIVMGSNSAELYRDNVEVTKTITGTHVSFFAAGVSRFMLGARTAGAGSSENWVGILDEAAVWANVAANATQRAEIYNGGVPADLLNLPTMPDPNHWFPVSTDDVAGFPTVVNFGTAGADGTCVDMEVGDLTTDHA